MKRHFKHSKMGAIKNYRKKRTEKSVGVVGIGPTNLLHTCATRIRCATPRYFCAVEEGRN